MSYKGSDSEIALHQYPDGLAARTSGGYAPVNYNSSPMRGTRAKQGLLHKKKFWIIAAVAVVVIAGAVVGGVVGSQDDSNSSKSGSARTGGSNAAVAVVPGVSIDSNGFPIYSSSVSTAAGVAPTVAATADLSCGSDPFTGSGSNSFNVRSDRPRLMAPQYKWSCLPKLIANDDHLSSWNDTIFGNATRYAAMPPTVYAIDGGLSGSGVLDVAREVQLRIKHWAYAWRMTNDTQWPDRAWTEILTAAGNNSAQEFGQTGNNWNTNHFLDVAEFTAAFAYAYDWMYDAWNQTQRDAIMWSILNLGLSYGLNSYTNTNSGYSWWQTTNGNWNCVCNGGLTMGALAILGDDPTGIASQVLGYTVSNAANNCMMAVSSDGSWSETQDYWYFGSTATAQMISSLQTATGSDHGLLGANPNYNKTGLFHMYGTGNVQKFHYGDCGPNKYTATANCMMFFGEQYDQPRYSLYQRDREDAPEPLSMFWYNPESTGDWWDNLALDHYFDNDTDSWSTMRSSWTNVDSVFAGIKAGKLLGHQTHGFLDVGTFNLEALGQKWAGGLCQANYLGTGYFSSEDQDSQRWLYYRTRTEGQNTILIGEQNQIVTADPVNTFGSTGEQQTSLAYTVPSDSAVYFTTDMSSAYAGQATSVNRGLRLLNGRTQMLVQDEIVGAEAAVQWRMHTNATITYSNNNATANLALGGEELQVQLLSPSGASFVTMQPVPFASDPPVPSGEASQNLANTGVSVLVIQLPQGDSNIQVLFNPQYPGASSSSYVTPPSVALSSWTTTSHN